MDCGHPHNLTHVFWHGVSIMKSRKPLLSTLVAGTLMFAGTLIAQDVPPAPPPPSATPDAPPAPTATTPPPARPVPPMPRVPGTQPMPPATPAPPMPPGEPTATAAPTGGQAATYQSPQGEVVVQSSPAPAPTIGPAPTFEQLSGGGKSISPEQALAYPPLANDFINADTNRNGSISKSEYINWTKQL